MPDSDGAHKSNLWSMVDKIVGTGDGKSGTSLPATLILLGVVVVIFSIMGVTLVLSRRRAARLAAQLRRAEEDKVQAEEQVRLNHNNEQRYAHQAKINGLDLRIRDIKDQIGGLDERNRNTLGDIAKITDWNDFIVVDKRDKT